MIMRKLFISALALTALFAVSCNKEIDNPAEPAGRPISIRATLDDATRTAYEGEKTFSWVAGDKISLKVIKDDDQTMDVITLTTNESGTSVTFSGSLPDGYTASTEAFYPKGTGDGYYYSSDLALQKESGHLRTWGTITPDLANPMGSIPLIGQEVEEGTFAFKTCTGILKFTVSNIPADTYFFQLDAPDGTALNGNFSYGSDCTLYMENVETAWPQKYVSFTPEAEGETRDFYLPIPVGTIPEGAVVSVTSSSRGNIPVATTTKAIEVVRNKVIRIPVVTVPDPPAENWVSLGKGLFIDTFVWAENNLGADPVSVEIFYDESTDQYKMPNPYTIASGVSGGDAEFFFSIIDKNRISHEWLNMGLPLSKNADKTWAMISGHDVAGYGNDFSHVVSFNADGTPAQVQIAPCYRTSDENTTGAPGSYDNEIGKDHNNGIIEIAFPGQQLLMPFALAAERVSVSANQDGDGTGAAGLVDNSLSTYWHTPWSYVDENADPVYGQYVTVKLPEYASRIAFDYCTRDTNAQAGAPSVVVVGGSTDGKNFTEIGTFELDCMQGTTPSTWVGLPSFDASGLVAVRFGIAKNGRGDDLRVVASEPDEKWCNLAELMIYGISTGEEIPYTPDLEAGQLWIKADQITVNSDAGTLDGNTHFDGDGPAALVDNNKSSYWHSMYMSGYDGYYDSTKDFDATYGIYVDVALGSAIQSFQLSYYTRHNNNNGEPRAILLAGSTDGSNWTTIATVEDDSIMKVAAGARVDLPVLTATQSFTHLRIGIIKAGNGDTPNDLRVANGGSTALAEILLFPK